MPKGVTVDVVGYWFPKDGKGPIANDTNTVLRSASNPVLAHLFLNNLMNVDAALDNISWNGYMQPLTAVTPERLVKEEILPQEPDVDRGAPAGFPQRPRGATASGRRRRALAAGVASRERRDVAM